MKNWIFPSIIAVALVAIIATAYYISGKIKQDKINEHNTTITKLKLILILITYLLSLTATWVEVSLFKDINGMDPSIFPIIAISLCITIFYIMKKEISRRVLIISGAISILISIFILLTLASMPFLSKGPGLVMFAVASVYQMYVAVKYRPKTPQPFEIRITI